MAKRGAKKQKSASDERPECFLIMPISDPVGYETGHFRRVCEDLFVPACELAGYHSVRADKVREANLIHLDILRRLINSPMAICDLSCRNPNVLFELGIRQAFDKPVVLVQERGTEKIFDINPLRIIEYDNRLRYRDSVESQHQIAQAITATRDASPESANSLIRLLSISAASVGTTDPHDVPGMLQRIIAMLQNPPAPTLSMPATTLGTQLGRAIRVEPHDAISVVDKEGVSEAERSFIIEIKRRLVRSVTEAETERRTNGVVSDINKRLLKDLLAKWEDIRKRYWGLLPEVQSGLMSKRARGLIQP